MSDDDDDNNNDDDALTYMWERVLYSTWCSPDIHYTT